MPCSAARRLKRKLRPGFCVMAVVGAGFNKEVARNNFQKILDARNCTLGH